MDVHCSSSVNRDEFCCVVLLCCFLVHLGSVFHQTHSHPKITTHTLNPHTMKLLHLSLTSSAFTTVSADTTFISYRIYNLFVRWLTVIDTVVWATGWPRPEVFVLSSAVSLSRSSEGSCHPNFVSVSYESLDSTSASSE